MNEMQQVELAKVVLENILNDKYVGALGVSIITIRQIRKDKGITRKALNEAKKQLRVQSINYDGVQYWHLPNRGKQND